MNYEKWIITYTKIKYEIFWIRTLPTPKSSESLGPNDKEQTTFDT